MIDFHANHFYFIIYQNIPGTINFGTNVDIKTANVNKAKVNGKYSLCLLNLFVTLNNTINTNEIIVMAAINIRTNINFIGISVSIGLSNIGYNLDPNIIASPVPQ